MGESSPVVFRSGGSSALPALILWVMHFAIVRLFYFMICYSGGVLPVAWFRVQVGYSTSNIVQSGTVKPSRLWPRHNLDTFFDAFIRHRDARVKHDGESDNFNF